MKRVASYIIALFAVLLPVQAQMGHFYFSERFTSDLATMISQVYFVTRRGGCGLERLKV